MVGAISALAVVVATLGSGVHGVVVEHVACEHGQLVELTTRPDHLIAPPHAGVSAAPSHDHHHCSLEAFFASSSTVRHARAMAPMPAARLALVETKQASDRSPLAYAPKTSPPL